MVPHEFEEPGLEQGGGRHEAVTPHLEQGPQQADPIPAATSQSIEHGHDLSVREISAGELVVEDALETTTTERRRDVDHGAGSAGRLEALDHDDVLRAEIGLSVHPVGRDPVMRPPADGDDHSPARHEREAVELGGALVGQRGDASGSQDRDVHALANRRRRPVHHVEPRTLPNELAPVHASLDLAVGYAGLGQLTEAHRPVLRSTEPADDALSVGVVHTDQDGRRGVTDFGDPRLSAETWASTPHIAG